MTEKRATSLVEQFLNYLRYERNRSEQTVVRYAKSLRHFEDYFRNRDEGLTWASVDADLIRGWIESLMDKGFEATSVNADIAALRTFFRFALSRGYLDRDPARHVVGPKKKKPLPQFLKEEQMEKLLDGIEWNDNVFKDVRARTILLLFYETGLRRAELQGLNDTDVDFTAMQLKVTGKRNKQRVVPFGNEMSEMLQHYIVVRNEQVPRNTNALFVSEKGLRIPISAIYSTVRENLSKVCMLKKRSPHVLRHTFATAMLNHDAGIESVRQLLGHESLDTTQIYAHTTFDQLKRVYKEAHPRG
jgi:integrase/recombinase XerC